MDAPELDRAVYVRPNTIRKKLGLDTDQVLKVARRKRHARVIAGTHCTTLYNIIVVADIDPLTHGCVKTFDRGPRDANARHDSQKAT